MIPKIIHQTGPQSSLWHPIWEECCQSWKKNFPDFEYKFWSDDDLRNLIVDKGCGLVNLYDSLPHHIMRVDFARFFILYFYGGIYVDLDIYCYKNFYDELDKDLYLLESWEEWGEKVQNSLMISSKNNEFWLKCIMFSSLGYNPNNKFFISKKDFVLESFGPRFITKLLDDESVAFLPKETFNPIVQNEFNRSSYEKAMEDFNSLNKMNSDVVTRHYLTSTWTI